MSLQVQHDTSAPIEELQTRALTWPEQADSLAVQSDASYAAAGGLLTGIKALRAEIHTATEPVIKAAHAAHKAAVALRKDAEAPLIEAENTIKSKLSVYSIEQEREARELRLRLEAEAQEREEEALLREAEALEAAGDSEAAEAILAAPVTAPTPTVAPAVPKVSGISERTVWSAEVTDLVELARAVVEGKIAKSYIEPNLKALNSLAKSLQGEMSIPGVRAVSTKSIAASAR